jgi:predicted TIM-barrel fold metal-dependent hydrolase
MPGSTFGQRLQRRHLPIIDVHLHCIAADERWNVRAPNPVTGRSLTATTEASHFRATLAEMDRYNIVKGMISGDYDAALVWDAAAPGRFIIGYSFDDPAKASLDFIRREYAAGRLKVIGEIGPQYEGIGPADPRLEPIFALAEELDIPVAYHVHPGPPGGIYKGFPRLRQSVGDPLLLEEVLVRHPKLRLYVMHAGWPRLEEIISLLHAYPQVYVDVAVIDWTRPRREFHEYLRRLVEARFGKRIMFGSDQMVWPEAIGMAVQGIDSARFLSAEEKRDIFYDNAVRFFRLDGKTKGGS